jgi:hypothetical protein
MVWQKWIDGSCDLWFDADDYGCSNHDKTNNKQVNG